MGTITVWMIVLIANSGHRVELPNVHNTEADCLAAAQLVQSHHPGASAACVANAISVSDERARQLANDEWWRNRPREVEAVRRRNP